MLAWMKPYQHQRNLAFGRGEKLLTSDYADKRRSMKSLKVVSVLYAAIAIAASLGCSDRSKAPTCPMTSATLWTRDV